MEHSVQRLQFLDLTDASENEQTEIERVLFTTNQVLEVPWCTERACVDGDTQSEQEWIHQSYGDAEIPQDVQVAHTQTPHENIENDQDLDGEHEEQQDRGQPPPHDPNINPEQPPRPGGIFSGHPQTSLPHQQPMFQMYQMVPSLSNVYVSNVTANVNVHAPYVSPIPTAYGHQMPPPQQQPPPPPQQIYAHGPPEGDQSNRNRRQRTKSEKKRDGSFVQSNEVMSPSMETHPPPQFPGIHPMQPYYLQGTPGGPLYMQPAVLPVYPSPMFNPYSPQPGHMVYPQPNNMPPGNEEYHENVQQNFHQPASEMVVVGNTLRHDNNDERRVVQENGNGNYRLEDHIGETFQNNQRIPDSSVYITETENMPYNPGVENATVQQTVLESSNEQFSLESAAEEIKMNAVNPVLVNKNFIEENQPNAEVVENLNQSDNNVKLVSPVDQTNQFLNSNSQNHEHLCYHTEVVVKLPKKRSTQNSEVELGQDVNNVDNIRVNINSSAAGRISEDVGHNNVPANEITKTKQSNNNSNNINQNTDINVNNINNSNNVQVIKNVNVQQESPVPMTQNTEFPLIGQNNKSNVKSDVSSPEPEQRTDVPPPSAPVNHTTPSSGKSWASLFNRSSQNQSAPVSMSDNKGRPLARVLPYHETGNVNSNQTTATTFASTAKLDKTPPKNSSAHPQKAVPNSNLLDDPYYYRLGEFLNNYELDHKITSLQPTGLTNRGNWCYINAILQSLIACPAFYNLMKALPVDHRRKGRQTLIIDAVVDFVNEFHLLPADARIGKREKSARNKEENNVVEIVAGPAFEPSVIYKVLDKVRGESSFNVEGRQEDAEEFLSCLLNGLNDEMYELMKLIDSNKTGLSNGDANGTLDDDVEEWSVIRGSKNKSAITRRAVCGNTPISDIFRGQLRSRLQRAGDTSTENVQPFFTLQLDIEKANSVKEALELLVGKDLLEGVTCTRTHQEVEAWTQMTIEDLPLVLIMHLKCFDYKPDGCSKIIKNVDFPVDLKIDAKLMSNRNRFTPRQRNYKLVAVVYHQGKEASKGHYVAGAYHVGYGCWIEYDDGTVRSVPESHVLKPRAPRVPYLLYYRRADTIGQAK